MGMTYARPSIWESGAGFTELYRQRIVIQCESILPMVYHESRGPNSWESIQVVFSLKVVCRFTPSDNQRRQAQITLRRLGERRGVDGICDTVVVPEREGIYADFLGMEAA